MGKGAAGAALLGTTAFGAAVAKKKRPNVLFIAVDDLRTQLGCYGHRQMISPNIDRLAAGGVLFERTYCQQAICAASRCSLLAGVRPDTTRIYGLQTPLRKGMPNVLSLPQHFKNNGYTTYSLGKIYHHRNDDLVGWSHEPFREQGRWKGRGYLDPASQRVVATLKDAVKRRKGVGPAFEGPDVADADYPDGKNTQLAVAQLRKWAKTGEAFFLALGYYKPHLPFNAPKRFWDMYAREKIQLPTNTDRPAGAPNYALTNWGEMRQYTNVPNRGRCSDDLARALIHAYYACVTYVDTLIGSVLDELGRLKLRDNTVIVLWGDHGWKLGEYGCWSKHTNFELDTRVPMIFAAPGVKGGRRTAGLTEFVDIYPTLCELCGLAVPDHLEGTSAVPLMREPARPWKAAAFSQYPRGRVMGYSMRTARYRYNRWIDRRTKKVVARELYDHRADAGENTNLAGRPAHAALVKKLDAQCVAGWRAARPPA
jgi:arylsulfatase A-like enzyme